MAELFQTDVEEEAIGQLVSQAETFANEFATGALPVTPHYLANVFHRNELSVHFRWKFPAGHLISKVRPHEPSQILEYRLNNYEQNTFPIGFSVVNALKGTLANPQVFSVQFSDSPPIEINADEAEDFGTYMTACAAVPGENFLHYFWDFIAIQCLLDSNGYVVIINSKSDSEVAELSGNPDPAKRAKWREPRPFFIPSSHVMEEGHGWMFAKATEMNEVNIEDNEFIVPSFWYFTEDITFKLVPVGGRKVKNDDGREEIRFTWDVVVWDQHGSGMAARKPRGIVSDERVWRDKAGSLKRHVTVMEMNDVGFYLSILSLAVPDFNRAVKILSDLESGLVASLFPIKTVELQQCPSCTGNGWVKDTRTDAEDGDTLTCTECNGLGKTFPSGPFAGVAKAPNEAGLISPAVVWSAPSTEPFAFAWKMYNEAILSGLKALAHGSLREPPSNTNNTARAKEIDMQQQHIIVREVAAIIYPVLQWLLDKANVLRYGKLLNSEGLRQNRATVMVPASFDISLMSDLFEQLKQMQENSMPVPIKKAWAERAIVRDLGSHSPMGKLAKAYLNVDKYALMSEEEIMTANARYFEASEGTRLEVMVDMFLHDHLETIISKLVRDNAALNQPVNFLSLPPHLQRTMARIEAKKFVELQQLPEAEVKRDDNGQ
jgi:hypothetical protein